MSIIDRIKNQKTWIRLFLLFLTILLLVYFLYLYRTENKLAYLLMKQDFISKEEKEAALMLKDKMIGRQGLICQKIEQGKMMDAYLLESMGQVLEYADYTGNKELKDEVLKLIFKYFKTREGYFSWQIYDGKPQKATALIDELHILKVLLRGERNKEDEYYIDVIKNSLYKFSLQGDRWVSFYDGRCGKKAGEIPLFYIDIEVMKKMADEDNRFFKPFKQAEEVLMHAPLNEYGFFPQAYDYESEEYSYNSSVNMVENILTNMHYFKNGGDIRQFICFLQREIDKGHIYNYYYYNSTPLEKVESTAVYALACQLFMAIGDEVYADICYKKMLAFQIKEGDLKGGFGDLSSRTVYAYDQLEALKTIRMKEGKK